MVPYNITNQTGQTEVIFVETKEVTIDSNGANKDKAPVQLRSSLKTSSN